MGVPTLWPILAPATQHETLLGLNLEHFSTAGVRAVRLGCDASIWLFHARKMEGNGEEVGIHADLRVLFFRLCSLLRDGVLPFFVFDGPKKPAWKRGKRVGGGGKWRGDKDKAFQQMLDMFGFPWRVAPGEAEAELAACAKRGEIDGVLTDDVDTLLFGAPLVVRNGKHTPTSVAASGASASQPASPTKRATLSSSQPSSSQLSSSQSTLSHPDARKIFYQEVVTAEVGLEVEDLIFCALLSGGDYAPGMMSMGTKTAVGLSLCGFGTELIKGIAQHRGDPAALEGFLARWRMAVFTELKTNSRGKLSKRAPSKAIELERDRSFPDLKIVDYYIKPAISSGLPPPAWTTEPDLPSLIAYASATFEWSNAQLEMTCRNVIYPGVAMRELRKSALALDSSYPASLPLPLASSPTLFDSIHDRKTASSTKNIPSYRVQLSQPAFESIISAHLPAVDPFPIPSDPEQQVAGRRKTQVKEAEGSSPWRHWMPVEMVEVDARGAKLARRWSRDVEAKEVEKQEKEARRERERGRKVRLMSSFMGSSKAGVRAFGASPKKGAGGSKRKRVQRAADSDDTVTSTEEEELAPPRRPGSSGLKSKSAVRRPHSLTDDSESSSSRAPPPPKSPRKSRTHTSPAKNRVKSSSSATVITLSSDDDDDELLPAPFASTSVQKIGRYSLSPPPAPRPPAALADSATANFGEQLPAVKSAIKASSKPRKMDRNSSQSSRSISSGSGGRAGSKSFSEEIDLVAEEEEEAGLPSLTELFEQRRSQSRLSGKSGAAVDGRRAVGRAKGSAAAKGGAPKLQAMEEIVISDSD